MNEDRTSEVSSEEVQTSSEVHSDVPNTLKEGGYHKATWGPTIGIVIIVAILVLGGLYFWGKTLVELDRDEAPTAEEIRGQEDPQKQALETQSNSDDISAIEGDVEATDFSQIDAELSDIEAEL